MHSFVCFWFVRSRMKQRWNLWDNKFKSLQPNTFVSSFTFYLSLFYSVETFKVKSSFWYYDVSTYPFLVFNRAFVFPGPRSFAWPPALVPNMYLLALAPNLYLPALAPNLYLPALANNFITSLGPDFAYTDRFFSICICIYGPGPRFVLMVWGLNCVYAHRLPSRFSVEWNGYVPSFYKKQQVAKKL